MIKAPEQSAETAIAALAEYLTGTLVAENSMALQGLGGMAKARADKFFKLRGAFGVTGYASKDEAEQRIRLALGR